MDWTSPPPFEDDPLRRRAREAREDVVSGALRGPALRELLLSVPARERDDFTDALLGIESPPPDAPSLPRGSVPYLPCEVDDVLAMADDVPIRPDDEFVDLGSGLGRVVLLVHLLTGARAHGIEIQEHLVSRARSACAPLSLSGVSFDHANAAEVELDGSVFFLYAPFNGPMLSAALRHLQTVARKRPIRVCTLDVVLEGETWLRRRGQSRPSRAVYDST